MELVQMNIKNSKWFSTTYWDFFLHRVYLQSPVYLLCIQLPLKPPNKKQIKVGCEFGRQAITAQETLIIYPPISIKMKQ